MAKQRVTPQRVAELSRALAAGMHTTCTRAELHDLLLDTGGSLFVRGELRGIRSKYLGAGVYRVEAGETV